LAEVNKVAKVDAKKVHEVEVSTDPNESDGGHAKDPGFDISVDWYARLEKQ